MKAASVHLRTQSVVGVDTTRTSGPLDNSEKEFLREIDKKVDYYFRSNSPKFWIPLQDIDSGVITKHLLQNPKVKNFTLYNGGMWIQPKNDATGAPVFVDKAQEAQQKQADEAKKEEGKK